MHLIQLLQLKFKDEVLQELIRLYDKNTELRNSFKKEMYIQVCKIKIQNLLKSIHFLEQPEKICKYPSEKRCCARIWDQHYGSRCRYKRKENSDYCQHHINMIKKNGSLLFNRYDEDKPIANIKRNKIPWFSNSYIEILDSIIQKQHKRLNLKIKINSIKDRQITP